MEKQNNVPKLRFPEFEGDWEVKKLGEVTDVSSGGTPNRAISYYWNGNIPWVSTTLIDFNTITETNEFITDEGLKNSSAKLFPIGTLLMAMYGQGKTRGKIAVLGIEASTNQACGAIMVNKSILDYLFVFQNLSKRYDEIRDLSNQGGQENLSGGIIKGIEISFPTLCEQQKIATFLSSVDEKLQALKKKKSLLEAYKKGMMQKIFSQRIRFKDENGEEFEEWEEKKLEEIFVSISTKKFQIKSTEFNLKGQYKVIDQGQALIAGFSDKEDNVFKDFPVIVFGDHTPVLKFIDFEFIVGADGTKLLKNKYCNNLKYLYYNLSFNNVSQEGYKRHFTMLTEVILQIPSLPEQSKIANFLTAIDEKLNKVDAQIKQMELWKKGLLQRMFV